MKKIVISTLLIVCLIAAIAVPVFGASFYDDVRLSLKTGQNGVFNNALNWVYSFNSTTLGASAEATMLGASGMTSGYAWVEIFRANNESNYKRTDSNGSSSINSGWATLGAPKSGTAEDKKFMKIADFNGGRVVNGTSNNYWFTVYATEY